MLSSQDIGDVDAQGGGGDQVGTAGQLPPLLKVDLSLFRHTAFLGHARNGFAQPLALLCEALPNFFHDDPLQSQLKLTIIRFSAARVAVT